MLELYMVACLLADPAKCHEQRLDYVSRNSLPVAVLRQGEFLASQWCNDHPGYYVNEIATRQVGLEAKI